MPALPEQVDLVRKDKRTEKWYPIGKAERTKTGNGLKCTIFPGQKFTGEFFIFVNSSEAS